MANSNLGGFVTDGKPRARPASRISNSGSTLPIMSGIVNTMQPDINSGPAANVMSVPQPNPVRIRTRGQNPQPYRKS